MSGARLGRPAAPAIGSSFGCVVCSLSDIVGLKWDFPGGTGGAWDGTRPLAEFGFGMPRDTAVVYLIEAKQAQVHPTVPSGFLHPFALTFG